MTDVPEKAIDAALEAYGERLLSLTDGREAYRQCMRAALTAAIPHLVQEGLAGPAWQPVDIHPGEDGPYLVFMPSRSLDRYSVQHYDHIDGWSNDFGITRWQTIAAPAHAEGAT